MRKFLLLSACFVAITFVAAGCKKNKTYSTSYVFWFDKATKDSLVRYGAYNFQCVTDQPAKNGEPINMYVSDTSFWYSSVPDCENRQPMYLMFNLHKGESRTVHYKIQKLSGSKGLYTVDGTLHNWEGTVTITQGTCGGLQLVW
jgi:hypothetical protein